MKTKKLVKLLLLLVVLLGGIAFVLALINNSDDPDKPDNPSTPETPGVNYNFKPLEFITKLFGGKSYDTSNTSDDGKYELKLNVDNVNAFANSTNYNEIYNVIKKGAFGLATLQRYDLKSFDVYSLKKGVGTDKYVAIRYRYNLNVTQSTETFDYYTYTKSSAEKVTTYMPNVTLTGVDVDLMYDLVNDKYTDIFDITPNGLSSIIDVKNNSFKFSIDGFEDTDYGSSYFMLENKNAVELTDMYDDYVERLSYFKDDKYPVMNYTSFFTDGVLDTTPVKTFAYDSALYSNRETNILRLINDDLDYTVGRKYGLNKGNGTYNTTSPIRMCFEDIQARNLNCDFKDEDYPVIVQFLSLYSKNGTYYFALAYECNKAALENGEKNIIESLTLYFVYRDRYKEAFVADKDGIYYKNGFNSSMFSAICSEATQLSYTDENGDSVKCPLFGYSYTFSYSSKNLISFYPNEFGSTGYDLSTYNKNFGTNGTQLTLGSGKANYYFTSYVLSGNFMHVIDLIFGKC